MSKSMQVPFYKHDISEKEIADVVATLKSGWINTGPKVSEFENVLCHYTHSVHGVGLNSATAGLFLSLIAFGIGPGDEVITTPYTFSATAAAILQTGARPVFVDIGDDFLIDPKSIAKAIHSKTKAIIPVDFGGHPADYRSIYTLDFSAFTPSDNLFQKQLQRPLILADASHSFGSLYHSLPVGGLADLSVFSFHVVKNITTNDGGAVLSANPKVSWINHALDYESLFKQIRRQSLHGMTKTARERVHDGGWQYDILDIGYKFNMTDLSATLGLSQFKRWPEFYSKRKSLVDRYNENLNDEKYIRWNIDTQFVTQSHHFFPLRIKGINENERNELIHRLKLEGVTCNVHYLPLSQMTMYKNMGYSAHDTPIAFQEYQREITLPLFTQMTERQVDYVSEKLIEHIKKIT